MTAPPTLMWVPTKGAAYYNVQLFRGARKIFSAWPVDDRFRLAANWQYEGRRIRLTPGLYRWYVFPGFGTLREAKYGPALAGARSSWSRPEEVVRTGSPPGPRRTIVLVLVVFTAAAGFASARALADSSPPPPPPRTRIRRRRRP